MSENKKHLVVSYADLAIGYSEILVQAIKNFECEREPELKKFLEGNNDTILAFRRSNFIK